MLTNTEVKYEIGQTSFHFKMEIEIEFLSFDAD